MNAFWSITMYDGKTQFLVKNPIDRYLINSPMLPGMKKNEDGSLTLYIQKDSPGKDKGVELAAGTGRPHVRRHAAVLAEDRAAVDHAARQGHLESAEDPRRAAVILRLISRETSRQFGRVCFTCGQATVEPLLHAPA